MPLGITCEFVRTYTMLFLNDVSECVFIQLPSRQRPGRDIHDDLVVVIYVVVLTGRSMNGDVIVGADIMCIFPADVPLLHHDRARGQGFYFQRLQLRP